MTTDAVSCSARRDLWDLISHVRILVEVIVAVSGPLLHFGQLLLQRGLQRQLLNRLRSRRLCHTVIIGLTNADNCIVARANLLHKLLIPRLTFHLRF